MTWAEFVSAFGLLFVAELGDKTQLAVISQVCKYRRPWPVFLGASLALAAVTGIGVAVGQAMGMMFPQEAVQIAAGALFVLMGLYIVAEFLRERRRASDADGEAEHCATNDPASGGSGRQSWVAFTSTFGLLFVAELGDKTQLSTLSLASAASSPLAVFAGATLALAVVSGIGVALGQGISRLIPPSTLKLISALAFILLGVLIGLGIV